MTYAVASMLWRVFLFIWCTFETFNIAQLYWDGYEKLKPTPVIRALVYVFLSVGTVLLVYSFIPMFRLKSCHQYMIVSDLASIVFIPLIFSLRNFRKESLKKPIKKHLK